VKNLIFISAILLLLFLSNTGAQTTVAPLQLGNVWFYGDDTTPHPDAKTTVVDTNALINSISYFKLRYQTINGQLDYNRYVRLKEDDFYAISLDTTYPAPDHELLYYKKDAVIGDTWTIPDPNSLLDAVYTIEDTLVLNVFGEPTTVKFLTIDSGLQLFYEYWTEKFGQLSRYQNAGGLWVQWILFGCVIDGVAYGDTSFSPVSIENEFSMVETFILKQNYPNPFNAITTISYQLPERSWVTLKVFDILGKEVAKLVNEEKPAGNIEVIFNASNLSSGIYFYTLHSGDFTSTRKLVLLK